jgi:hypothetical protein
MIITDAKWNDIVAVTSAWIDKWKATAAKRQRKDDFTVKCDSGDKYTVLLTTHHDGYQRECHAVAREIATGELRAANLVTKRRKGIGRIPVGYSISQSDPKGWNGLANKSAEEIVKKLRLTNFVMFLGASVTEVTTTRHAPRKND